MRHEQGGDRQCEWQFLFEETANSTYFMIQVEKVMQLFFVVLHQCYFVQAELSEKLDQADDVGKGGTAESVMSARRVRDQRHSMTY